jgi:hypothetical protein
MAQPRPDFNATVRLFPRRKKKGVARPPERGRSPMRLGNQAIVSLFGIPQADAACQLGISLTTLKVACRKLGISRWPYTRRRHGINEADAGSCHCPTSASQGGAVGRTHSSEETMHAGERAVQTYQRHQVADAIFSQSETFDDSDMQAPEDAVDVVVRAIPDSGYEPENDENEQGHTLQDSDLSWLVSDIPNYHLRLTHTRFALHSAHAPFWVHQ